MITLDMTIAKIIKSSPEKIDVLMDFGLDCIGCLSAKFETLEQASKIHGIDLEILLYELNQKTEL